MPVLTPVTVTEGDGNDDLPDDGSSVTAEDHNFSLAIEVGADTLTFSNDVPDQFHHAIFFPMAAGVDEDEAEAAVEAFLQSEDDSPPPEEFDFGTDVGSDTNVVGPGLGVVQPQGNFEAGRTYAVLCFIPDRAGGPPHAISHDMWKIFTVEG